MQLRVKGDKDFYHFEYAPDGKPFQKLGSMDAKYISTETAGGFTGIVLGMYASSTEATEGYGEFDFFEYRK